MKAAAALALATQDPELIYTQAYDKLILAITGAARSGSTEIKLPAFKELSETYRKRLYKRLRAAGYTVTDQVLPDSKIEPNRPIVVISWAS